MTLGSDELAMLGVFIGSPDQSLADELLLIVLMLRVLTLGFDVLLLRDELLLRVLMLRVLTLGFDELLLLRVQTELLMLRIVCC